MKKIKIRRLKRSAGIIVSAIIMVSGIGSLAHAWETTEFWTPCIIDVHPYAVPELMIGNFFTIDRYKGGSAFPTDIGVETGVLPFDKVQMEVGMDAMEPSQYPYMFNAKIGTPEDAVVKGFPGIAVGIFGVGTEPTVTGYNTGDVIIGKTIPYAGRLHVGYYYGNKKVLVNGNGGPDYQGWMAAYDSPSINIGKPWMDSLVIAADYASGDNTLGGGGFGVYFNFTKTISLLTGPVWFNDPTINGSPWKWTTQIYVNF